MNKIQIELPEYLTIEAFSKLGDLEGLTELQTVVRVLSAITGQPVDTIERWNIDSVKSVYTKIMEDILDFDAVILPVFEYQGILWGMQSLSKMKVGEYIDLERLMKENNIAEVMAIIYRPIINNKLDSFERKVVMNLKAVTGKVDNIMKWYEVEPYDNTIRWERSQILKGLPMAVASGAYSFFLLIGIELQNNLIQSSPNLSKMEKEVMRAELDQAYQNFMDGFLSSRD
jgi:hypothetical protein